MDFTNVTVISFQNLSNANSTSNLNWIHATSAVRRWVKLWMLLISCVGTPANLLVLECARRILRHSRECLLPQYFVYSMTVADLAFTSVYASAMYNLYASDALWSPSVCGVIYGICHCSSVASSLSLFCLNVDKFVAITRPLQHAAIMTRGRVLRLVTLCWLASISWSIYFVTHMMSSSEGECGKLLAPFTNYCLFTLTFFIGPTLAAFCLSLCISVIACRKPGHASIGEEFRFDNNGKITLWLRKGSPKSPMSSTTTNCSDQSRKSSAYNRPTIRPVKTLTFVFATTAWSFVTCVPYRIMYLFYISFPQEDKLKYFSVTFAFFVLLAMNSLGNPFITILTQRRYITVMLQLCRTVHRTLARWLRTMVSLITGVTTAPSVQCPSNSSMIASPDSQLVNPESFSVVEERQRVIGYLQSGVNSNVLVRVQVTGSGMSLEVSRYN